MRPGPDEDVAYRNAQAIAEIAERHFRAPADADEPLGADEDEALEEFYNGGESW